MFPEKKSRETKQNSLFPKGPVLKVTVDLQRPNFANFFFFVPDIAKISI